MSSNLVVKAPVIAALFGVSSVAIGNWSKDGMPKAGRGLYSLKDCLDWWLEHKYAPPTVTDDEIDSRERYWSAKADKEEMSRDQAKGSLIPLKEVLAQWAWRAAELRTNLQALSSRLPQKVDGLDIHQSRAVIKKECADVLRTYCRDGRFTPAPADPAKGAAKRCRKKPAKPTTSRKRK